MKKWIDVSVFRFCISADVDRSAADSTNLAVCKRKPVLRSSFILASRFMCYTVHDKRLLSLLTVTFCVGKSKMSMCNSNLRFGIKTSSIL